MTKYVFSCRVPAGFAPRAETGAEWEAWLGGVEAGRATEVPAS